MTPQEAKALFEEDLKDGKCNDNCPECNAKELAISALKKQIPKRPNRNEYGYFICPTCNSDDDSLMYDSNYAERYNYCHECGQALDWSDTE